MKKTITLVILTLITGTLKSVFVTKEIDPYIEQLNKEKTTQEQNLATLKSKLTSEKSKLINENQELTTEINKTKRASQNKLIEQSIQKTIDEIPEKSDKIPIPIPPKFVNTYIQKMQESQNILQEIAEEKTKNTCKIQQLELNMNTNKNRIDEIDATIKKTEDETNAKVKEINNSILKTKKEEKYDIDQYAAQLKKEAETIEQQLKTKKNQLTTANKRMETEIAEKNTKIAESKTSITNLKQRIKELRADISNEIKRMQKKVAIFSTKEFTELNLLLASGALVTVSHLFLIDLGTVGAILKNLAKENRKKIENFLIWLKNKHYELRVNIIKIMELNCLIERLTTQIKNQKEQITNNEEKIVLQAKTSIQSYKELSEMLLKQEKLIRAELTTVSIVQKGLQTPEQKKIQEHIKKIKADRETIDKNISNLQTQYLQ